MLLFARFASMLALIEDELGRSGMRENHRFVKLTGRSGLNLTAADTRIHYAPWRNPAAERQATGRAHRIGQDEPVFVCKLLTEGTVEQRVAELRASKQALAGPMLAGDPAAAGPLSAEDLDLVFGPISDG